MVNLARRLRIVRAVNKAVRSIPYTLGYTVYNITCYIIRRYIPASTPAGRLPSRSRQSFQRRAGVRTAGTAPRSTAHATWLSPPAAPSSASARAAGKAARRGEQARATRPPARRRNIECRGRGQICFRFARGDDGQANTSEPKITTIGFRGRGKARVIVHAMVIFVCLPVVAPRATVLDPGR